MAKVTDVWYEKANKALKIPQTDEIMTFYKSGWQPAEGGTAKHNAFNTTLVLPGSTKYNSINVQNYVNQDQGVEAFVSVISETLYAKFLAALRAGKNPYYLAVELGRTVWGTDGWEVCQVLHDNGVNY